MGKRITKSEKLDLILAELTKLRRDIKKLVEDRAAVADHGVRAKRQPASDKPKKPQQSSAETKSDGDAAPAKPVSVQSPPEPAPSTQHRLNRR
jgi:hypothetical protein